MSTAPTIRGPVTMHDAEACGSDDIVVLAEGGAICSESVNGQYHLSGTIVRQLCESAIRGSRCTSDVQIIVPEADLVLSDDVSMHHIESFGQRLQSIVQHMRARSIVVLAGSHKVPRYATAAMLALTPEDMGVGGDASASSNASRSLVIASTRHAVNVDHSAATETMRNALQLTKQKGMKGRAAALFGDHLYALPGLARPEDPSVLQSRFPLRGHRNDRGNWYFAPHLDCDTPVGDGSAFELEDRVRTYVFGGESEYKSDAMIDVLWSDVRTNEVQGLVIKKAGFRNPLVSCDEEKLETIDGIGIPVIAVGERNGEGVHSQHASRTYKHLLDGGHLFSGEAKLLLSYWLKGAENAGCREVEDTVAFVRQKLDAYPFR